MRSRSLFALAALSLGAGACIPYSVGSTAQTVPAGQQTFAQTWFVDPVATDGTTDRSRATVVPMANIEFRGGLNDFNDLGVRLVPFGVIGNVKHRFGSDTSHTAASLALMSGFGLINFGHDLHLEETLIASGRQDADVSPYGGVRVMQAMFGPSLNPTATYSVSKSPTVGAFAGMTIGDFRISLRPEIAVYYGQADIHAHGTQWVVVPSLTLTRRNRAPGEYGGGAPY